MGKAQNLEDSPNQPSVQARFHQAVRDGNPEWLWPDTKRENWRACLESIEGTVRAILMEDNSVATLEGNPSDMSIACYTSGMGPLLGHWGQMGLLRTDPSIQSVLDDHLAHNRTRMEKLCRHASVFINRLTESGIQVVVLKGMHTAYSYFPSPGSRPLSDIDLWVDAKDFKPSTDILRSLDYHQIAENDVEQTWRLAGTIETPRSLTLVHRDNPWSVDLHHTLDRRFSPGAKPIRMDRIMAASRLARWSVVPQANTITGTHLVFYLALHASSSRISLSMLRLTELILVIRHHEASNTMCWDHFKDICLNVETPSCVYPALRVANKLAPGAVPPKVLNFLEELAPLRVKEVISPLAPANSQRVDRCSFRERVMWISGFHGWIREIWLSLFPRVPLAELFAIYHMRLWRIARGNFPV